MLGFGNVHDPQVLLAISITSRNVNNGNIRRLRVKDVPDNIYFGAYNT